MTIATQPQNQTCVVTNGSGTVSGDAPNAGAAYVYTRDAGVWTPRAYIKASNTGAEDLFGGFVAMSSNGDIFAINARAEDSAATGINGDQANNDRVDSGATYIFRRSGKSPFQTMATHSS